MAATMRRFTITFLALLLPLTHMVLAADMHAEAFTGRHSSGASLYADNHGGPHENDVNHEACHHCCHAQAHLFSLPQDSHSSWTTAVAREWGLTHAVDRRSLGHAPPVPPPKA